jgi:hypothetical protein
LGQFGKAGDLVVAAVDLVQVQWHDDASALERIDPIAQRLESACGRVDDERIRGVQDRAPRVSLNL